MLQIFSTTDKKIKFEGIMLPSALDMHVHFRDPGYPHKEDWKSGSESAACGGVTAVVPARFLALFLHSLWRTHGTFRQ